MKSLFLSLALAFSLSALAQSPKYAGAMQARMVTFDTARTAETLTDLANSFERIAEAEKTQWHPYYYAALAHTYAGYQQVRGKMGGMAAVVDPVADKADALLAKAEALSANNSEIWVVRKMILSLRMLGDPMNRYMSLKGQIDAALETAQKLNPDNPRIYLLQAQDLWNTPEQFGGSKTEAKKLFGLALQKFDSFRPDGELAPNWGRKTAESFLK